MRQLFVISLLLTSQLNFGQVVFQETFDEADDAVTGVDNIGGVAWSTSAPGAVDANDYFKVIAGILEAKDTNSPADWETADIDITSCVGLAISLDIRERGDLEACGDCVGDGDACIDWLKLEYNLDGLGWTEVAVTACPITMTNAPGDMIHTGNLALATTLSYTTPCIDFGSTLQLRISVLTWAASEFWEVDNVTVFCNDCVLPVEVGNINARPVKEGTNVSWTTASERENDYFELQRSLDGQYFESVAYMKGAGNSSEEILYNAIDPSPKTTDLVYYRLKQVNFDGTFIFSDKITYQYEVPALVWYANNEIRVTFKEAPQLETYPIIIYDLSGKIVAQFDLSENTNIPWDKNGFYIVEIPSLDIKEKVATF